MPETALLRKLGNFASLTDTEKDVLHGLSSAVQVIPARKYILRDGERPEHLHLITSGWAMRYKILPDGGRQIVGFLLPGDFCDFHVTLLGKMDHGVQALTECTVAFMPSAEFDRLTSAHGNLTNALWLSTLVDQAVLRSWLVNNARRNAFARIAHLLCELHLRLTLVGLVEGDTFNLPLTQEELADTVGLTPVHTNRILQRLRKAGLIELGGHMLTVLDVNELHHVAGFDPSYLHIDRRTLA